MKTPIWYTGFPRGRPRTGEARPPSPNAITCAKYRKARLKRDPAYLDVLRRYQVKWRRDNIERSREISRLSSRRARVRENLHV